MTASSPAETISPPVGELVARYDELRAYVELTDDDFCACKAAWPLIEPHVEELIDDFYANILKHPEVAAVIRGGQKQVDRLQRTLKDWLERLFSGNYDQGYIRDRWLIGWRHVSIGLPQVWTAAAMSRMRDRLLARLVADWNGTPEEYHRTASAISRIMDLDLTLIQDAYHVESIANFLRGERDLNEAIIGTTQSIVLAVDSVGNIIRGNTFLAQLVSGRSAIPDEIKTVWDLIPENDCEQINALISQTCFPQPCGPSVTHLRDTNGRDRTIRWFARTVINPPSKTEVEPELFQLLVGHDVTDLVDAQRRAVQQERLAAIGQTMAGLAHESRNAFQRSQAALETLALDLEDRPESVELIERIQRANDHLLHLYQEVLQFAKPVRLDIQKCCLRDIVYNTCLHVAQVAECGSERFKLDSLDSPTEIMADPYALEQIVRNLVENALQVSGHDQQVEIRVNDAWIGDQPAIRLEVRDRGPGIAAEYRERIFEPFFSTRSRGTGLGLPIARRLTEAHGGSLDLVPAPGQGTIAVLNLPKQAVAGVYEDPENQPDHRRLG